MRKGKTREERKKETHALKSDLEWVSKPSDPCDKAVTDAYLDALNKKLVLDSLREGTDFFQDKLVEWEIANAKWTGHWFLFLSARLDYDSKGYTAYDPLRLVLAERLQPIQSNQWRLSGSVSWVRNTRRVYSFLSLSPYWLFDNSYEDLQNKQYKRDYVTETGRAIDSTTTQYITKTKNAYDGGKVAFRNFHVWGADFQATAFVGKAKTVGLNAVANYAYSSDFTVNNRMSVGIGPVIALAPGDKEEVSKTNFGTLVGWNDLFNPDLQRKEKLFVRFFVNIPVRLFAAGK